MKKRRRPRIQTLSHTWRHMESPFQPRLILNAIRSIAHCRRSLMVEKDDGRYESKELESAFSGMVSMDKALLNVLTSLISNEVKKRRGSLEVGVSRDISLEEDLETVSVIIGALEPSSSTSAAAPALAHMKSPFQPRRILNSIRSIEQCRTSLMAEKDDGKYESEELKTAFSTMVSVEKAVLNVLRRLISDKVKRRGSLEVGVNGDINSDEDLEMLLAIISALEPSGDHQQQQEGTSS